VKNFLRSGAAQPEPPAPVEVPPASDLDGHLAHYDAALPELRAYAERLRAEVAALTADVLEDPNPEPVARRRAIRERWATAEAAYEGAVYGRHSTAAQFAQRGAK
jgi:hypothetical protein